MSQKISLEKHKRYKQMYCKNEVYWGIGIENEMYLECLKKARVSKYFFLKNHARERYSIDYYTSYLQKLLDSAFYEFYHSMSEIELPLLVNSHSFTKTDRFNQPQTTYEKEPKPNPLFCGETLHEYLMKNCPYFADHYNVDFVYDGDTIEFITQNFYKTTVSSVLQELSTIQTDFIREIKPFFPFGDVGLMSQNHPFAIRMTNMKNVSMFNNGTYHINITLPTFLNDNGDIDNHELFVKEHQNAIRLFQLFEPIFIVMYGSPDPFHKSSFIFSPASQRCAVSRYIGVGTYPSSSMQTGKLLNIKTAVIPSSFWYHQYHAQSAYTKLEEIGIDINFNKHHYHGIEMRIFDYFSSKESLNELMECIVYLLDHSLQYESIHDIVKTKQWNELVVNCMRSGKKTVLCASQMYLFNQVFNTNYRPMLVTDFYKTILVELKKRYRNTGVCSRCMLDPTVDPTVTPTVTPTVEPIIREKICLFLNKMCDDQATSIKDQVVAEVNKELQVVKDLVNTEATILKDQVVTEVNNELQVVKDIVVAEATALKDKLVQETNREVDIIKYQLVAGATVLKDKLTQEHVNVDDVKDLMVAEAYALKDKLEDAAVSELNTVKDLMVAEANALKDKLIQEANKEVNVIKDQVVAEANILKDKLEQEAANIIKNELVDEAYKLEQQAIKQVASCCIIS